MVGFGSPWLVAVRWHRCSFGTHVAAVIATVLSCCVDHDEHFHYLSTISSAFPLARVMSKNVGSGHVVGFRSAPLPRAMSKCRFRCGKILNGWLVVFCLSRCFWNILRCLIYLLLPQIHRVMSCTTTTMTSKSSRSARQPAPFNCLRYCQTVGNDVVGSGSGARLVVV